MPQSRIDRQPTDLLFLFYPLFSILWNDRKCPGPVPPVDRGIFLHRAASDEFVKNLSKSVQESFTNSAGCWGILWLSEGKTPSLRQTPFNTLFSFFHLFFLPSFSFCIGMYPVSSRKQGTSLLPKAFAGQKQIFHRLFKICSHIFHRSAVY